MDKLLEQFNSEDWRCQHSSDQSQFAVEVVALVWLLSSDTGRVVWLESAFPSAQLVMGAFAELADEGHAVAAKPPRPLHTNSKPFRYFPGRLRTHELPCHLRLEARLPLSSKPSEQ